jgi:hypothetical protein
VASRPNAEARKKSLPARRTTFISATSLPMVDGLSLKR